MDIWAVDPLVKVFPDMPAARRTRATADVARGEHASFQVVVRCAEPIEKLSAQAGPFTKRGGDAIEPRPARFVGYVFVDRPTQSPSKDRLRTPPAEYPDPLIEDPSLSIEADHAQAIWITVAVPETAEPGTYRSEVRVTGQVGGATVTAKKKLVLDVYPATVTKTRLWTTQWFGVNSNHMESHPEGESDAYYDLLRRFAENMADHRQNVALISPLSLADFAAGPDGSLEIDFARFDRWVELFQEAGVVGLIEGGHIGGRKGGWESEFVVQARRVDGSNVVSASVDPASEEADRFYAQFFPALVKHLREKGWLECYVQHLADEPIASNIDSYRAMADLARRYAPDLRIIEACHTKDLVGAMDVWVPQLNFLHNDFAHYQERQAAGDEVWFYTCVFPQGEYANRFIEQPLVKTRLLHWINFRYGITGYLHWGYNHWTNDSPYTHTTRPHGGPPYLPAGDPWIVYPGRSGPLDSIRYEAMRDGIVDHELLSVLAEKEPKLAARIVERHILDFHRYNTDPKVFRETRRELLRAVSRLSD